MRHFRCIVPILLAICCLTTSSPVSAQSARDIMAKVDDLFRKSYSTQVVKIKLATCKYTSEQEKMRCTEKPRIVVFENTTKRSGIDNKDTRAIAAVLEPISDKGIGVLTYEYSDPAKDNDNWLYLSALGKVKRIISSNEDDESGSFFGSEFSVGNAESIEYRKIDDYTYKILQETTYEERPVWIIESIPTSKRAEKSRYSKFVSWIDREKYILLREELYNRHGDLYKYRTERNYERIDTAWVARKVTMNNVSTRRVSIMEVQSVGHNMEVSDEFLTQRTLTDFAFRERNLAKLRTYLK